MSKHQRPEAQVYTPKPYQRAWLEAFEDPYIEKIVLKKSARTGYAIFINTANAWIVANDPDNILIVENTETDAGKFAEGEIGKVFKYIPAVSDKLVKGAKNTATEKTFYGGQLIVGWATSASTFRMATIRYFFADEVSGWPDNTEKEGCGIGLGIVRTETKDNRKIVIGSTPKLTGTCKISREFEKSDQRYLYIPCPHCEYKQRLKLANLRYDPNDFKGAHFVCESCTGKIKESHKYEFMQRCEWRASREFKCCGKKQKPKKWDQKGTALCQFCNKPGDTNELNKVEAGFHIWTAYNDNANTSFAAIAKHYHTAKNDPDNEMQRFMNTVIGADYAVGHQQYELKHFDVLHRGRIEYDPQLKLPEGTLALFATADTQKDRFDYHVWAIAENQQVYAIDYSIIDGHPESNKTQQRLINILEQEYSLSDGRAIAPFACALDCQGNYWQSMLEFVAEYEGFLFAIRGSGDRKARLSHDVTLSKNKHIEADCTYRTINVHKLKNTAAEYINNTKTDRRRVYFPVTDIFGLTYFKMLTAEHLIGIGQDAKWEVKKGFKRNEPWDLLVYCLWLMSFFRSDLNATTSKTPLGLTTKKEHQIDAQEHEYDLYEVNDVY